MSAPAFDLESLLSQGAVQHPETIKASPERGFSLSKLTLIETERASAGQAPAAAQSQWDLQDKSSLLHHLSSLEVSVCCFTHPRESFDLHRAEMQSADHALAFRMQDSKQMHQCHGA